VEKYCHRSIRCNNIFPYRKQANVKDTIIPASRDFQYDLFLSHSAKDNPVARPLAMRRTRVACGLRQPDRAEENSPAVSTLGFQAQKKQVP
jgi:hypothetical protein